MAVNIGPRIGIEGEEKYRQQLVNIIQTQKTLNAELKASESAFDGNASAQQKATTKASILNQQIKTQKDRIAILEKELEESAKAFGENDTKTLKWRQALAEAQTELNRLEGELREVPTKLQLLGQKFEAAGQKMQTAGQKIKAAGDAISSIGSKLTTTVTTPVLAAATAAVKLGSDYEENLNKVDVAFGSSAKEVKAWAKTATREFGMSESAALDATSSFGDMATSMGLSDEEAAKMAISLAGLSGDLSSFKNIDIKTAMTALKGVFTGETESLKGLGIVMTETNLKGFAEDMGLVYGEMSQAEKVTLRYQYVMEKTANAQGDYLRTSDGFANSFRTLKAEVSNLGASFGQELLPYVTPLVQKITEIVKEFGNLDESTKQMIIRIGGLAAAIGPVLYVGGKLVSGIGTFLIKAGGVVSWIGNVLPGLSGILGVLGPMAVGFGLAAGAGAALGFALKGLKDKYGWSSEISDFNDQVMATAEAAKQARDKVQKTTEALQKTSENAAQIMEEADAAATLTDRYAEELYDLAGKTNRTADEQRRMEAVIASLNKLYPGFTDAVLDSNGSIKMGTDDLRAYIDELKNTAKIEALKRIIDEYTEKIVEADMAVVEAEMALEDAQNASSQAMDKHTEVIEAQEKENQALAEAQQKLNDLYDSGTATAEEIAQAEQEVAEARAEVENGLVDVNGETVDYEQALSSLNDTSAYATDEAEKLAEAQTEAKQAADDATKKQEGLQKQLDKLTQEQGELIDSTFETVTATEESGAAAEEAGESYTEFSEDVEDAAKKLAEAQQEIRDEYEKTRKSAYDSTMGQKDLWKELEKAEDTSLDKMKKGLASHHEALSNWNNNASALIESAEYKYNEGFRNMVNTVIQGGEDLAPELQVIYDAWARHDGSLEELLSDYGFTEADAAKQADILAYIESVMENGLEATNEAIKKGVEESNRFLGESFRNPKQLIDDIATGAKKTALKAFGLYKETGSQTGIGYGQGAASSTGAVQEGTDAVESTAESGVEKVENLKTDAQTAGTEIGEAIAKGARAARGEIDSAFTSIRTAVSTNISQIQNRKTSAKTAGMQIVTNLNDGINSALSYVTTAMNGVKKVVETGISGIQGLKSTAYAAGNTIGQNIAEGLGSTEGANKLKANAIVHAARQSIYDGASLSDVYSWGNHIGSQFASGIGSTEGANTLAGRRVAIAERTEFSNADNADLYAWGNHMGHNFADGIAASEGAAVLAARKVANAVANILRHTTPKEGPLKDDDVWGLHMGENFANGMLQAVPDVAYASTMIADAAAIPTATMVDIDAVSGRNVAERLTSADIMDAFMAATENIDWRVVIGNREFGRILREQGAFA